MNSAEIDRKRLEISKLEAEIFLGERAKKAYDLWIRSYIEKEQQNLFEEFKTSYIEAMPLIQYKILALSAIDTAVKQDIESGHIASKWLDIDKGKCNL